MTARATVDFTSEPYFIHIRGEGTALLDVYQDLYEGGRAAWLASKSLQRLMFPIRMVGGALTEDGTHLSVKFFLDDRWQIKCEEGLDLLVRGNLSHDKGRDPFRDA